MAVFLASAIVLPDAAEPQPSGSGIVRAFARGLDLSGETMTEALHVFFTYIK